MTITTYSMTDDMKSARKNPTEIWTYQGATFKDNVSLTHPTIILGTGYTSFQGNYCKVEVMGMDLFYFIDTINSGLGGMIELVCSIDPLMTLQSEILESEQLIVRQAADLTPMVTDPQLINQVDYETRVAVFPSTPFNIQGTASDVSMNYVIQTSGAAREEEEA